ncbi:MAG: glycoside hydrolase family 15 protein [Candidatus Hydrothermarchaeota archaeon]
MINPVHAILGNGSILVTYGKNAKINQIFWPNIDGPWHVNDIRFGIHYKDLNRLSWISGQSWEHNFHYLNDTNILRIESIDKSTNLKITSLDYVLPKKDVLIKEFCVNEYDAGCNIKKDESMNLSLVLYENLHVNENSDANCVYYEGENDILIHFRRNYVFGFFGNKKPKSLRCGTPRKILRDLKDGDLKKEDIALGNVSSGVIWDLNSNLRIFLIAGNSREDIIDLKNSLDENVLKSVSNYWKNWIKEVKFEKNQYYEIYKRSLLILRLLCDNGGGIIAAPEFDKEFLYSGGYGFSWGRDSSFVAMAFDRAGYHNISRKYYEFCMKTQEKDGIWYQRYQCDGTLAPSWGLVQIDETGSILHGISYHITRTKDRSFARKIFPCIEKAVSYLISNLDEETGLQNPCMDLWEQDNGVFAYSNASVYAGILSASRLASFLNKSKKSKSWRNHANELKDNTIEKFWLEKEKRFAKSLKPLDKSLDSSLIGLSTPNRLLDPMDPRIISTIRQIEKNLTKKGGIIRFRGDRYWGENPWTVTTLWLALYYAEVKNRVKALSYINWCLRYKNELGLIPEQLDAISLKPVSAIPLGWAHALLILALDELF